MIRLRNPLDKQKPLRKSTRLQGRVAQQNLADNLPAVSQPAQSEPLDVGAPTSMDYNSIISLFKINI